jgi:CRISPR/Cas system CSM-associated protein Csm3 (group 7 of RAMP superfamily)
MQNGTAVPELPGEAVKAVIREAAERILRWGKKNTKPGHQEPGRSTPTHSALARLFAPQWTEQDADRSPARYFFRGATGKPATRPGTANCMELMEITSTRIDLASGTAAHNSLRTIEVWKPDIDFDLVVTGESGDWTAGRDRTDLHLLLMAILCADSIGGGWGSGRGGLALKTNTLACKIDMKEELNISDLLKGIALANPQISEWIG